MNIAFSNPAASYNNLDFSGFGIGNTGNNRNAGNTENAGNSTGAAGIDKGNASEKAAKRTGAVECQTCKNRTYQDVSNDPGVSFKAPGKINPGSSGAVVMSHEQEHVSNESAKASREGRKIVSQSVRLQTSVCPECGRSYVSGGVTTTVTKADNSKKEDYFLSNYNKTIAQNFGTFFDARV